jgi:pimeloyl-ACP methyl ester carboxylesterase
VIVPAFRLMDICVLNQQIKMMKTLKYMVVWFMLSVVTFRSSAQPAVLSINKPVAGPEVKRFLTSNNLELEYAEQGDIDAPVLIMLHGFTDSRISFSRILPMLPSSMHVVAISMRGHGNSGKSGDDFSVKSMSDDVIRLVEARKWKQVSLLGHSMGGVIAMQTAMDHPERVSRLILVGTDPFYGDNAGMPEFLQAVETLTDPVPRQFSLDFQLSTIVQPIEESFLDELVAESEKLSAKNWRLCLTSILKTDLRSRLPELNMPVTVFWGEKDAVCDIAGQQEMWQGIKKVNLIKFAGIGHALHWEAPREFVEDLKNLIR